MQRSLPLKTIGDVKAFERNLSENLDEYNKFVSCILALSFTKLYITINIVSLYLFSWRVYLA